MSAPDFILVAEINLSSSDSKRNLEKQIEKQLSGIQT
jgi:hypothetical protein